MKKKGQSIPHAFSLCEGNKGMAKDMSTLFSRCP